MKKHLATLLALILIVMMPIAAADIVGTGVGGTREEARAFAVQDIKAQIIVEQQSTTTVHTTEETSSKNGKKKTSSTESLDVLITEYSRELPLEGIVYEDTEDKTAEFGENWSVTARIPSAIVRQYMDKINQLSADIIEINKKIENDNSIVKNSSWTKTLLDLSYDYISYTAVINRLDPSIVVPPLPISMMRVKLEYEDSIMREKNQLETEIASMSLLFADGVLDEDDLALLEASRNRYSELSKSFDELNGKTREASEYRFTDYKDMDPVTASDYLRRIEANRQAFAYYRSGPYDMEDKLIQLSKQAIADLDSISEKTFSTSGDSDDISFEILKWSDAHQGWIGRATIVLGDTTLQFSFLVPFADLTGATFNETTFERWNKEIMKNPEDILSINLDYTVKGSFIGNEYEFKVRKLSLSNSRGEVFYKAENKNPKALPFTYGTNVDLGDVGNSSEAKSIRAKANQETKSSEKMGFYVVAEAGGKFSIPFIPHDNDSFASDEDRAFGYGGFVDLEAGVSFTNGKEGRDKQYYGGGIKANFNIMDTVDIVRNGSRFVGTDPIQYEVTGAGFWKWPTDGTLDRFAKVYGDIGAGFGGSYTYFVFDIGGAMLMNINESMCVQAGATLRAQYGAYFEIGIKPTLGVEFTF